MIKEAYVSYEVAKLLKEKGFDEPIQYFYKFDSKELYRGTVFTNTQIGDKFYNAPTHQMAMAWLREEKYIPIFIVPAKDESGNLQYMADVWTWNEDEGLYEPIWCTADYVYEKTVEAALKYALENLVKEAEK